MYIVGMYYALYCLLEVEMTERQTQLDKDKLWKSGHTHNMKNLIVYVFNVEKHNVSKW
jgi:hypothetical protein